MPYTLGDSTPLILRGGGAYNDPSTAAPYTPPPPQKISLINAPGGAYNLPDMFTSIFASNPFPGASSTPSTGTPPVVQTRKKDYTPLLLAGIAVAGFAALTRAGGGRYVW
jgi:hypothetical protein